MTTYTGTSGTDTYTASSTDTALYGLGGNDNLSTYFGATDTTEVFGGDGNDNMYHYGGTGNGNLGFFYGDAGDDLAVLAVDDAYLGFDGGLGVDTLRAPGARSDWSFGSVGDFYYGASNGSGGSINYNNNVEVIDYVLGNDLVPVGAQVDTYAGQTFNGTSGADLFFFDNADHIVGANDAINNFSSGDRIVTTELLIDPDSDGDTVANSSDRFDMGDSFLRVYAGNGSSPRSTLILESTQQHNGVDLYVYKALGDTSSAVTLDF